MQFWLIRHIVLTCSGCYCPATMREWGKVRLWPLVALALALIGGCSERSPGETALQLELAEQGSALTQGIISVQVADAHDDAEQTRFGRVRLNGGPLDLGGRAGGRQLVGLRFPGLEIPPQARIKRAFLRLTPASDSNSFGQLILRAEATGNAAPFDEVLWDVSRRQRSGVGVFWRPEVWRANEGIDSADLSPLVQAVVDRDDWQAGNALAVIVSGRGRHSAHSYHTAPDRAPVLHVEYDLGSVSCTPTCGDTQCTAGETCDSCPDDCGPCTAICGDGQCTSGEDCQRCPADCQSCPELCGNGACAGEETCSSCPGDCGTCESCGDGECTNTESCETCREDCGPCGSGLEIVEVRVGASSDDAEEFEVGELDLVSTDLELVDDGSRRPGQTVGVRFTNVQVPQSAYVTSAYLVFTADEADTGQTSLIVRGEATDDSATFSDAISSRPVTEASVAWSPAPWTSVGAEQQTPELAAIVSEIVNRPGWAAGNALSFIITGLGERTAASFDGDADAAPLLRIEYAAIAPDCGDGFCEAAENCERCAADCGECPSTCGDGTCDADESCGACMSDCGVCPAVCGDTACDGAETCLTCENDCGQCPSFTGSVEIRVVAADDDAEEAANGSVYLDSTDLELVDDGSRFPGQTVGVRFDSVPLPPGAVITRAHVEFTVDEVDSGDASLIIHAEASDHALPLTSDDANLTARAVGNLSIGWTPGPWETVGEVRPTPDLSAVVQEVVNRSGWRHGNALTLIVTGQGERTAAAFDGSSEQAPRLVVDYLSEPPQCGDGWCHTTESCAGCDTDCGACPAECGDGVCDTSESCASCQSDCGACICGDGACDANESCASCQADCGECPARLRFAAIGDFGEDGPGEAAVAELVKSWDPDFVITVGDNNYTVGSAATIDQNIGKHYQSFIGNYQGSYGEGSDVNRFWPTLGNHDWMTTTDDLPTPHLDYFTLPGNERYYDVDLGLVHLFALDSDEREPDGATFDSIQGMWYQERIAASTACWNIVFFHHAPYSSARHGNTGWMQWPFEQTGADVVVAGHDHTYERLQVGGIPYFVNGLGGRTRYGFNEVQDESVVRFASEHGAMLIEAEANLITYRFFTIDGTLVDEHSVSKACQ